MKSKSKHLKIGIVILHFGDVKDTRECLLSLSKLRKKNLSLVVYLVDNDPKNRFLDRPDRKRPFAIKSIRSKRNLGFGGGVNLGVREAMSDACDYILLLNNDVVLKDTFFDSLLPYFAKKNVGMISPVLTYYDDTQKIWCCDGKLHKQFLYTTFPKMNVSLKNVSLPEYKESDFAAAALIIKADVFRKAGFFEEKYFLNVEDVEWCYRARMAGFRLLYIGLPLAAHKVSANTGIRGTNRLGRLNAYYYGRNFFIFLRDHRNSLSLPQAIFGQLFIRLPFYLFFRASDFQAASMYVKGFFDGGIYLVTGKLHDAFEKNH